MSRGHSLDDIRKYSLKKFTGFLEAIHELEKEELKLAAMASRISQAEKKEFEKFLKEQ